MINIWLILQGIIRIKTNVNRCSNNDITGKIDIITKSFYEFIFELRK